MAVFEFNLTPSDIPKLEAEYRQLNKNVWDQEVALIPKAKAAGLAGKLDAELFVEIARWKSARPTPFYKENTSEEVQFITTSSFAADNQTEKVLLLTKLKGVSIRTATAILHLCFPEQFPLLDVWAMAAGDKVTDKWNELDWLRIWPEYTTACRTLAQQMNCNLRTLDRALWAKGKTTIAQ